MRDGDTFTEVPEEEIIKGYEQAKGHHVLIYPSEIDDLKLEAKHTIDMVRFVDEAEIDSRYYEKPYYLCRMGRGRRRLYVIRDALKQTRKVAVGQLIMHGREHLVGVKALGRGLALYILRYAESYASRPPILKASRPEPDPQAVKLAAELIERESGRFEPEKMADPYAEAIRELIQAKIENRAPEVVVATEGKPETAVVNIMAALKKSMEAKGRTKVRDAVRKRMGKRPERKPDRPPRGPDRARAARRINPGSSRRRAIVAARRMAVTFAASTARTTTQYTSSISTPQTI